ncbi:testicular haploid expressed gene protein-like [Anastrepha obliqua]|uniref:testicular haploid expressed gene protein-like n=1 Tax=Anastrepha obliqua TaxID=95512 RepID=UPI00240A81F2|nr:testicular haploid expressed gene protein-like [Anastrepha obliqua]
MLMQRLPAYRPQCCITPLAVAAEQMCFFPELRQQYSKLLQRYHCMVTNNRRIWALAEPKHQTGKYRAPCFCPEIGNRKVEIVREDTPSRTRTEQLSFPAVTRLMDLKASDYFKGFSNQRKSIVNRMLRKSMLSLYSRLSNKQSQPKKEESKKLTVAENIERQERMKRLAKPKPDRSKPEEKKDRSKKEKGKPVKQQIQTKGFGFMGKDKGSPSRRYKKLATPKQYEYDEPKEWTLTNNLKFYTPSERILNISKPRIYEAFDAEGAFRVKESALSYQASERIKELALPPIYHQYKAEVKEDPFKINPNALKAKTSQRIIELAEPKEFFDKHTRPNAYRVSPRALRARMTPRLRELAKPKEYAVGFYRS